MATTLPRQLALAEKHFKNGKHDFAEKLLRDVIARAPGNPKANELLAYITGNRGELDFSFELLKTATAAPGASGEAYYYLGRHFLDRGLFEQAASAYQQSLRMVGRFFEGLMDLGVALAGRGKAKEAIACYDEALAMRPDFPQAWYNKGVALDDLKRFDDALQCYDKALALDPGFASAWDNRSATLNTLGRYTEALASHDKAIALNAASPQAWSNRGATLLALKRYEEALACNEKALVLNPDFAEAWFRAGGTLAELKYPDKALTYFAKALDLKPDIPFLRGDWLRARLNSCQWQTSGSDAASTQTDIDEQFEKLRCSIDATCRVATPFVMLAVPASPARQRRCAEIFCEDRIPAGSADVQPATPAPGPRIRIGYFSPDFRSHAVSYLTAGLLECHDRTRFEIHAFALTTPGDDPMTARIQSAVEHFHDVTGMTDREVASLARRLNIDIAIDLAGHTLDARTGIFARRAAPVQAHYLGFPGSMGATFMDYILADAVVIPEVDQDAYSEKVVYLPHCFQVNDAERRIADIPSRSACGLDDSAFVFCCFNNSYKLTPAIFDIWMNLLQDTDRSLLWLIGANETQMQNLRYWASARGVSPDRLIFAGHLPYAGHLARYGLADLVLDTLPFNGGTTTSDALWAGAPVLTCTGNTFAGRMATSLLRAMGLDELITATLDDYQARAQHLAHHPAELAAIKRRLTTSRDSTPLFNTRLCTRHIEAAYTEMWRRHATQRLPDHIRVMPIDSLAEALAAGGQTQTA